MATNATLEGASKSVFCEESEEERDTILLLSVK